jgi:hypothetical protein
MAAVATVVITATLSSAFADSVAEEIHACAKNGNGQLRVVDEGEACRPSEHPVAWGAEGPPGPPGPAGQNTVAGIITPDGEVLFGEPFGGSDFTVTHLGPGLYQVDVAQPVFPGLRCPITLAQSFFTAAHMTVPAWTCDPSGYHVTLVTSDGNDAGFWFQILQIQDDQG